MDECERALDDALDAADDYREERDEARAQLAAAQERVRVLEDLLREVHGDNRAADLENGALYDPSSEFAQRIDAALAGTEPAKG